MWQWGQGGKLFCTDMLWFSLWFGYGFTPATDLDCESSAIAGALAKQDPVAGIVGAVVAELRRIA